MFTLAVATVGRVFACVSLKVSRQISHLHLIVAAGQTISRL